MKFSNPWKIGRWRVAAQAVYAVAWLLVMFSFAIALALSMTGCASVAGKIHSPLVGLQYERALGAAEQSGFVRARTVSGHYRWLAGADAKRYRAARDKALESGGEIPAVSSYAGMTDDEIVEQAYPTWLRWAAKIGDGAVYALATFGAARAADSLNDDGGSESSYRDRRDVAVTIPGDGNNVNVNIGQYAPSQSAGDTAPAEEGGAE